MTSTRANIFTKSESASLIPSLRTRLKSEHSSMAVASTVPIVLVTGASGYIGARLVKELLIKGDCIVRGSV